MAQYLESLESVSDYYNIIDSAAELAEKRGHEFGRIEGHEAGLAEGIVIGREEGREEEKLTAARNFKRLGVALSTIAEATGLSLEVIEGL